LRQRVRLTGAQASGEKVTVDVGRNLALESQQDSDRYDARQTQMSGGISVPFGAGSGSANFSASKDKLHSNFDSVKEQTGLFAGQGGYDVKVKEHTQLDGAVIASQADKEKNLLDTGTLGWTDIHNQADYSATHSGGSFSTGGPVGKDLLTNMAGGMLSGANHSGHAEGTTKAGVSEGTLIVRDTGKQQQDVAQLNRDTEHANDGSISPIFNKEKEQNRLKQAQLIGEIGGQAMDVIRTQGDIAGLKAQKDPAALAQAREQLEKSGKPTNDAAVMQRAYDNAMRQYGTGSDLQKAAQAVTGALTALAGNNLAGALASGASPYLATEIKKRVGEDNMAANAMAHAVLGAVTAQLNNQSAAAGGLGASGGELAARYIAGQLFPGKTAQQLSESEKQQVSALSQLAAGLAGGLATGDTAGAVTGGQAGKTAVENNHLNQPQQQSRSEELAACNGNSGCRADVRQKYAAEYDHVQAEIANCASPEHCISLAKELKGWLGDYSARMTELETKARNEGIGSLTTAETQEWVNLRGAMSNIDASRDLLVHRAQILGGSKETSKEIASILGQTGIASAAGVAAGVGKGNSGNKGSAIPAPEPITATNGLVYKSNPKHTLGQQGNRPNAGIEPKDSVKLFEQSIPSTKQYPNKEVRFAVDSRGVIHRFEGTNGQYHWNGSTGDKNALTSDQIPSAVQKQLGVRVK